MNRHSNNKPFWLLTAFSLLSLAISTACILTLLSCGNRQATTTQAAIERQSPDFSVDSAYAYIADQCAFGPRTMQSEAHDQCAQYLQQKFQQFGATVTLQQAEATLYDGTTVPITNIIASTQPDNPLRIIICSHWDSRPWADNDPDTDKHHTPIDGANDGASGVGVMLECARQLQAQPASVGVDFICFDAEDCGTPQWATDYEHDSNTWCLGSQHWAMHRHQPGYTARYGILLDMVGGRNTIFRKEAYSLYYAPSVVDKVWAKAQRLGYGQLFRNEQGSAVTDDHLQVNQSGIPCIDIIANDTGGDGFCETWHTMLDNVANIDKTTLEAVGQTILEVIYTEQ